MSNQLSLGAKIAWFAVLFMLLFVVLPAAMPRVPREHEPKKEVYTQPLLCRKGEDRHGPVLICDYPMTPTGLNQRVP